MAKSRKLISFSLLSLRGAAGGREGRASNRIQGWARPLYRLTLAGPPFPLPFPCLPSRTTSPSLPRYLSPTSSRPRPSHRRLFLNAGADQRVPPPDEPASTSPGTGRRKGASARASPALRIAFSAACSPAAGGRRTAAPPTPPPRVLKGWAPLPGQTRRRLRLEPCVVFCG